MKKLAAIAMLIALTALLCGCGTMIVEDAEPVRIGFVNLGGNLT